MGINNLADNIIQSANMIVEKKLRNADFDRTIFATIVSCEDATIGKYKVKYQDGYWYAYSNTIDTIYNVGASVCILIPRGDMSNENKTIIGSSDRYGINYVSSLDQNKGIIPIGNNVLSLNNSIELHSGLQEEFIVLYNKNNENNIINIDDDLLKQYIQQASFLLVQINIRTDLPFQQKHGGIYGIQYQLDFINNTTGEEVTRTYVFDINSMQGNPYNFNTEITQSKLFNIDNENFVRVSKITAFLYDFQQLENPSADIFISNLLLTGAELLSGEDLSTYALYITCPNGHIFTQDDAAAAQKTLIANIKIKGQLVNNQSQSISYYWFVENPSITSDSIYYTRIGGKGWRCLNEYNILQTDENQNPVSISFIPASAEWKVTKSDIKIEKLKYKCVAIYNTTTLQREINITNKDYNYTVLISSSNGNKFNFDIQKTTLTAIVISQDEQEQLNLSYSWFKKTLDGNIEAVPLNSSIKNLYNQTKEEYDELKALINTDELYYENESYSQTETYGQHLITLENTLKNYSNQTFIDQNILYNVFGSVVDNYVTYMVNVIDNTTGIYLGSADITLTNSLNIDVEYSLLLNNGVQVYKYDTWGLSPVYNNDNFVIPVLSFDIYDKDGDTIDREILQYCQIQWWIPKNNTMLIVPNAYEGVDSQDGQYIICSGALLSFSYSIKDEYSIDKNNNQIILKVKYNGYNLSAKTNLSFIKQGNNGTNGSEYNVRLVPVFNNVDVNGYQIPAVETVYAGTSINVHSNYTNRLFNVQLWHNGQRIFNGYQTGYTTQNKPITIEWSVLKNIYTNSISDYSDITTINKNSGNITSNGPTTILDQIQDISPPSANIIQAKVIYNDLIYYATNSVLMTYQNDYNYRVRLKNYSGFRQVLYSESGKFPEYTRTQPFDIAVYKVLNNNNLQDITDLDIDTINYSWTILGSYYNTVLNGWSNEEYVIEEDPFDSSNKKWFKVIEGFDGLSVNQSIVCHVTINSSIHLYLQIPIYIMVNRYKNQNLNDWNGNSIALDNKGGYIISPQVGAGVKQSDNSFTGVFLGRTKENRNGTALRSNSDSIYNTKIRSDEQIGLFGYTHGQRSIFLDAETGKAQFGLQDHAKIILDPSEDTAIIKSGNYLQSQGTTAGKGMAINLSQGYYDGEQGPWIKFGSGNFMVDKNGNTTMHGTVYANAGEIGGASISNGVLQISNANITGGITIGKLDSSLQNKINKIDSVSVYNIEVTYATSNDPEVEPDQQDWQSEVPQYQSGLYIWQRTVTTYADGSQDEKIVCLTGQKGQDGRPGSPGSPGQPGQDGISVVAVIPQYAISDNYSSISESATWLDYKPEIDEDEYLWLRQKVVYSDNTIENPHVTYSDPTCDVTFTQMLVGMNGISSTVTEINTILGQDGANFNQVQSTAEQAATHFSWLVQSGTSSSNMTLTNDALNIIARDINLTGRVTFSSLDSAAQQRITGLESGVSTLEQASARGLGIKINYSAFSTQTDGQCYLHGFVNETNIPADIDGYIYWKGNKITVSKKQLNPNNILPFFTTIYIILRLNGVSQNTGNIYMIYYDGVWKFAEPPTPSAIGNFYIDESLDIVLGQFIIPSNGGKITDAYLYNPPRLITEISTGVNNFQYSKNAVNAVNRWATDATSATTTINGGFIQTQTITSAQLATDAIMSNNYDSGVNNSDIPSGPFSHNGAFLDLSSGYIYMPGFGVNSNGTFFQGEITAQSGSIGSDDQNYWAIGDYTTSSGDTYSAIIGHGISFIQSGNWQISENRINTQWYNNNNNITYPYYTINNQHYYYDCGMAVPNITSTYDYERDFLYIRRHQDTIPIYESEWNYPFRITWDGKIYATDIIITGGGSSSTYVPLNGDSTITGNLTVDGNFVVTGNLTATNTISGNISGNAATATSATQVGHNLNINNQSFNGSSDITINLKNLLNASINTLDIGVDNAVLNDNVKIITQDTYTANTTYYRRSLSKLWDYIKTKIESDPPSYESLNLIQLTTGNLIVNGSGRFANGLIGNLTGTASHALKVYDVDGIHEITFRYSGAGVSSANWFPAWSGYNIVPISPENVRNSINAMYNPIFSTKYTSDTYTADGMYRIQYSHTDDATWPVTMYGDLFVSNHGTMYQIYIPDNHMSVWKRIYNTSNSTWGTWSKTWDITATSAQKADKLTSAKNITIGNAQVSTDWSTGITITKADISGNATASTNGWMSASDKSKLDQINVTSGGTIDIINLTQGRGITITPGTQTGYYTIATETDYLPLTGETMTGSIVFNASTTNAIKYTGSKTTNTMIRFINNTNDSSGNGINIGGGGLVMIGAGQSSSYMESLSGYTAGSEQLLLGSDYAIDFFTKVQEMSNNNSDGVFRARLDENGWFYPWENNSGAIGTNSKKWANMYATTFHGALDGNAATATTATSSGKVISTNLTTQDLNDYITSSDKSAKFYYAGGSNSVKNNPASSSTTPSSNGTQMGMFIYPSAGGHTTQELASNGSKWIRYYNGTDWSGWAKFLSSSNYSSYALSLSGGTITGALTVNGVTTHKNEVIIQTTTVGSNAYNSANPKITFKNSGGDQNVQLVMTDYDAVVGPASLTLTGNQNGTNGGEYFIAPNIRVTTRMELTANAYLQYNSTNKSIDFIFR